jgi:hypothetical protein
VFNFKHSPCQDYPGSAFRGAANQFRDINLSLIFFVLSGAEPYHIIIVVVRPVRHISRSECPVRLVQVL